MLANTQGYPCPINDTYENTTKTYHASFDFILNSVIKNKDKCKFVVASHNEDTVLYAVNRYGYDKASSRSNQIVDNALSRKK